MEVVKFVGSMDYWGCSLHRI